MFHMKGSGEPVMKLILCVLEGVAEGMRFIHDNNIVHGELELDESEMYMRCVSRVVFVLPLQPKAILVILISLWPVGDLKPGNVLLKYEETSRLGLATKITE